MKKARQDPAGVIREIAQGDPITNYHADVAKLFDTDVPDDAVQGAKLIAGVWTNPPPPTEAELAAIAAERAAAADASEIAAKLAAVGEANANIIAKLAAADLKIIRALIENDIIRLDAFKLSQSALRKQLQP